MVSSINNISYKKTTDQGINNNTQRSCMHGKLKHLSSDTVCFKGKKESGQTSQNNKSGFIQALGTILKGLIHIIGKILNLITGKKDPLGDKFAKIWIERGNDTSIKIADINKPELPAVIYNPVTNSIGINHNKIPSTMSLDEAADVAEHIVSVQEKLGAIIDKIAVKSSEKIGIPEQFIPNIYYTFEETQNLGAYQPGEHYILMNTYWLSDAKVPSTVISEVLPHELSHAHSNLKFSLVHPMHIPGEFLDTPLQKSYVWMLQNTPEYRDYCKYIFENKPLSEKKYSEIRFHLLRHLIDINVSQKVADAIATINKQTSEVFKQIKAETGLNLREISTIDLEELYLKDRIKPEIRKAFVEAQFSEEELQTVLEKVSKHKDRIKKLMSKLIRTQQYYWNDLKDYADMYDEAVARTTASIVTGQNLEDGTIEDTASNSHLSAEYRQDLMTLFFKTDPHVRGMIESGKLQLDAVLLQYIAENQDKFNNISLKNQKNYKQ